jgi:hypothetical protein
MKCDVESQEEEILTVKFVSLQEIQTIANDAKKIV